MIISSKLSRDRCDVSLHPPPCDEARLASSHPPLGMPWLLQPFFTLGSSFGILHGPLVVGASRLLVHEIVHERLLLSSHFHMDPAFGHSRAEDTLFNSSSSLSVVPASRRCRYMVRFALARLARLPSVETVHVLTAPRGFVSRTFRLMCSLGVTPLSAAGCPSLLPSSGWVSRTRRPLDVPMDSLSISHNAIVVHSSHRVTSMSAVIAWWILFRGVLSIFVRFAAKIRGSRCHHAVVVHSSCLPTPLSSLVTWWLSLRAALLSCVRWAYSRVRMVDLSVPPRGETPVSSARTRRPLLPHCTSSFFGREDSGVTGRTEVFPSVAPFRRLMRWVPTLSSVPEELPVPWTLVTTRARRWPGETSADAVGGGAIPLANTFGLLGVQDELSDALPSHDAVEPETISVAALPGTPRPKGPRNSRAIRDVMQPVSRRRASRSLRVIAAHAVFLQRLFRRVRRLAESRGVRGGDSRAWSRGALRGLLPVWRPVVRYACQGGANLASDDAFAAQRRLSGRVLLWYRQYPDLLRKLSKTAPAIVDLFCGGGGCSEGIRRAGLTACGVDAQPQPDYVRRFGEDSFTLGDALLPDTVFKVAAQVKAIGIGSSPPCKSHSTAPMAEGQEPSAPPLLRQTHAMLTAHGLHYWVENVLGADAGTLDAYECVQRGSMHGLHVDRPRRFWTSFEVHLDEALVLGGRRLQAGTCLGGRRRFLRLDPMGRPDRHVCCAGNLYAVQGTAPTRSSVAENAVAMGVDAGHMGWEALAQSVPPVMAQLIAAQLAMRVAHERYGVPIITFDEMLTAPARARRVMARWFRGAGNDAEDAGIDVVGRAEPAAEAATPTELDERWEVPPVPTAEAHALPTRRCCPPIGARQRGGCRSRYGGRSTTPTRATSLGRSWNRARPGGSVP